MKRFVLKARVALTCAALFALSGTALAGPDLSGKSDTFKTNYQAFYVACLEKSAGRSGAMSACETEAMSKAGREESKLAYITQPSLPSPTVGPVGPVALPPDGSAKIAIDNTTAIEALKDADYIISIPIKITNYRIKSGKPIDTHQPLVRCLLNMNKGGSMGGSERLPVFVNEGDDFEGTVTVNIKKDEGAPSDIYVTSGHCQLWYNNANLNEVCETSEIVKSKSFCSGRWDLRDGDWVYSSDWR